MRRNIARQRMILGRAAEGRLLALDGGAIVLALAVPAGAVPAVVCGAVLVGAALATGLALFGRAMFLRTDPAAEPAR